MNRAIVATVGLTLAFLVLMAGVARPHDDAAWIQTHPIFSWCCGPKDCGPLANSPGISTSGYLLEGGEIVPHDKATPISPDGRYWRCRGSDGKTTCFFTPPGLF